MTFLEDLISDTAGSSVPLSELLRRVRVLASRARAPELAAWAKHEAEGYGDLDLLPPYRGPLPTQVFANFTGPYQSYVPRVPLAIEHLPTDLRERAERHFENYIVVGVGEIESQLASMDAAGKQELVSPWKASLVALINFKISAGEITWMPMHQVETIYRTVTSFTLTGVLEAVRSRLLDLLLAIDEVTPEGGEETVDALPPPEQVQNIFNTVVMEGATAAIGITPTVVKVVAQGLPDRYAAAIAEAAEDAEGKEEAGFLRRVAAWVSSAGREIFVDVAAETLKRQIAGTQ